MGLLDGVRGILAQYASASASSPVADAHFEAVAQAVDPGSLAEGIAAAMRSDETAPFAQMVAQLFAAGTADQKMATLNTLLSAVSPAQRARLASLVPAIGDVSVAAGADSAAVVSPGDVQTVAQHVERHDAGIIDRMSALYASHPTLVRTLGTAAMVIAMRKIAQRHGSNT